jgi:hypothetical protein
MEAERHHPWSARWTTQKLIRPVGVAAGSSALSSNGTIYGFDIATNATKIWDLHPAITAMNRHGHMSQKDRPTPKIVRPDSQALHGSSF